jgi:hypothetical protein
VNQVQIQGFCHIVFKIIVQPQGCGIFGFSIEREQKNTQLHVHS